MSRVDWGKRRSLQRIWINRINTLQQATTHCTALRHIALHCNTLQHSATRCNTLQHTGYEQGWWWWGKMTATAKHCNTQNQHTATYCNVPHYIATHCNTQYMRRGNGGVRRALQHAETYWIKILQHTATHCNIQFTSREDGRKWCLKALC